jgi:hypothetical protein
MMKTGDILTMVLKYVIFGVIIFIMVRRIPSVQVGTNTDIYITVASVVCFILLELSGGFFKKIKVLLCGCSTEPPMEVSLDTTSTATTPSVASTTTSTTSGTMTAMAG